MNFFYITSYLCDAFFDRCSDKKASIVAKSVQDENKGGDIQTF